MTPPAYDCHAPRTVGDAIKLLGHPGPDAKLLAGGHSLLPLMKLRFAQPKRLIDLGKIAALRGIAQVGNEVEGHGCRSQPAGQAFERSRVGRSRAPGHGHALGLAS